MNTKTINPFFAKDVKEGLTAPKKRLSSRYFYDQIGDKLFQAIMHMKEYYPTTSEYEIFSMQQNDIISKIAAEESHFNLIEFGAGDGYKTKILLNNLVTKSRDFTYIPIDISESVLKTLESDLKNELPDLEVAPLTGEYFSALKKLNELDDRRKVILFLGSNIGNFTMEQSRSFLSELNALCKPGDQVFIGFDLKKDPTVILKAYGDPAGITKEFNLNLLRRINRELDANFDLNAFDHFPFYDPQSGTTKSFLISKLAQEVEIKALNLIVRFEAWEEIHTEISQKFSMEMISELAESTNFSIQENFFDCKHYYTDSLWTVKKEN